jgi:hypothetical protein
MIKLKDLIYEGWGGMLQANFYWLSKEGKGVKVNNHLSHAALLSKNNYDSDMSYQWMFDNGWARVSIEDHEIYVNTSLINPSDINLTKAQKEWLKMMRDDIYPHQKLNIVNIYRRNIEI